jgi:glycosyltransferase involved in cell wall biosynthesis
MDTVVLLEPALDSVSGVGTHLYQLLKSKLKDQFRLHHFQVGSEGRGEGRFAMLLRFLLSPWQLLLLLLAKRPVLVHINTSMNPKAFWRDVAYLLIARGCVCKVVYQVHGGALPREFTAGSSLFERFLRQVLAIPDVIVLLGEFQRRAYDEFRPNLPVYVAANAIDVEPLVKPVRKGTAGDPLKLVFMGRLAREKGVYEIIEAVALLLHQGIDVILTIAGVGPEQSRLAERIAELGLSRSIVLKGAVFGEEKNAIWLESDVFVFPTFHREGLPYALLESMAACTVPVTCQSARYPTWSRIRDRDCSSSLGMRAGSHPHSSGCTKTGRSWRGWQPRHARKCCSTTRSAGSAITSWKSMRALCTRAATSHSHAVARSSATRLIAARG